MCLLCAARLQAIIYLIGYLFHNWLNLQTTSIPLILFALNAYQLPKTLKHYLIASETSDLYIVLTIQ